MEILLAHGAVPDGNSVAFTIVAVIAMVIPLVVLGVVCWIFLKAKRREDAERKREKEWRSVRSS